VFDDLVSARTWVQWFVDWYNNEHLHSAIKFITPSQRHVGNDAGILAYREQVYRDAKARHPKRWSGNPRNWTPIGEVHLTPEAKTRDISKERAA
jgi:putative transposase